MSWRAARPANSHSSQVIAFFFQAEDGIRDPLVTGVQTCALPIVDGIAAYNDDDCRATLALRDWLVAHRPDGMPWARVAEPPEPDDAATGEREALRQALVMGSEPGTPRWLAGELLEYHRREARPA